MADKKRPKHFDYEALDQWERHLRSLGFEHISVKRKYQGHDISHVQIEMTLVPWEPLPEIVPKRR